MGALLRMSPSQREACPGRALSSASSPGALKLTCVHAFEVARHQSTTLHRQPWLVRSARKPVCGSARQNPQHPGWRLTGQRRQGQPRLARQCPVREHAAWDSHGRKVPSREVAFGCGTGVSYIEIRCSYAACTPTPEGPAWRTGSCADAKG